MPENSRSFQMESKTLQPIICSEGGPQPPNPMVVERFQSVISQLFTQRIIRMGGAVDDDMANLIVAQLLYLDSADPKKDITLYINSPGGSVTAGMAIFDTMRHIRPDVSTVCVGLAASMGAFLLASGQQGKRYSLPNSRIMIHQPLGGAQGQAADIEIQANEILHHKLTLNGYLVRPLGGGLAPGGEGDEATNVYGGCRVFATHQPKWQVARSDTLVGLLRGGLQALSRLLPPEEHRS